MDERELYMEACGVLPGGISRNVIYRKPHPHYATGASGCRITDIRGISRIDFANNMASLIHGHAHPSIVGAVTEQIRNGTAFTLGTETEIRLARHLCNRSASFEKVRFVNSGTEAVMAMVKAARAYTGRSKIAKAEGAYHGAYDYVEVSQRPDPSNWGEPGEPGRVPLVHGTPQGVLDDVIVFPFNDTERTIALLDKHADEIACVLVDPVPHKVGLIRASAEFITALSEWTRKHGALLAFDEVISFRISYGGAQETYPVTPDLTALGKIIGGGFPVGAVAGRTDVMKVLNPQEPKLLFPLSGTFSANPVTMTAGLTAMELYDRAAITKLNILAATAKDRIHDVIRIADVPVSLTGDGSMFKIHLKRKPPVNYRAAYEDKETSRIAVALINHLYEKDVIVTNSFSCMFSTVLTEKEIDALAEALLDTFRKFRPELNALHGT